MSLLLRPYRRSRAWVLAPLLLAGYGVGPVAQAQSSGPVTYTKTETIVYHDDPAKWVLGQVATQSVNGTVVSSTTFNATTAQPLTHSSFGKLQQTLTYNADGTVATVKDGSNNATTLSNWHRGIPRNIQYADGTTQSAVVNDNGWITTTTDESGFSTNYGYDAMGRLASIVYPTGDSTGWNTETFTFTPVQADEHGLAPGHWTMRRRLGNRHVNTYYDAMWRPVLEEQLDYADIGGTLSQTVKRYDTNGRLNFQSYPLRGVGNYWEPTQGIRNEYDALNRVTSVKQDSELGQLTTTTEYLAGFQTRVTNPRGLQTSTQFRAYDQPTTDWPIAIAHPEGTHTDITRDMFDMPTAMTRRNADGSTQVTRHYVYGTVRRLCMVIEPETGTSVFGYDGADNLTNSASGLPMPSGSLTWPESGNTCGTVMAGASARRVDRTYDTRNRLQTLSFPDGRGNQVWSYTPDGLPSQITTYNEPNSGAPVVNAYSYNKRRLLTGESVAQPGWYGWGIGYGYDANGALLNNTYPTGLIVNYSPNALGQATAVTSTDGWTYASGVSYYPNGAIKQFTYGNGVVHTMAQNARQLPQRSTDSGGALDLAYTFDANANVTHIWDHAQDSGNGFYGRWMSYDGLDRLTDAGSCSFGGDCWHRFTYDALDNMKSWKLPGIKDYAEYVYDAKNQLTNIKNSAGASVVGLGYDVQGNLANKNGQIYEFDYGNRLRGTIGQEWYRYDGHGRRVLNWRWSEAGVLSQYSQSGQLMYDENYRASGRKSSAYIYLAGSLVATNEWNFDIGTGATKYQHTDALGSPVAVTNAAGAVIERTNYEPYGAAINKPAYDGIGYTGHVMDGATGLINMQQRYYDPMLGIFLSVDPVTAYSSPVTQFHRYRYANNNPYSFTDPDGRCGTRIKGHAAASCTSTSFNSSSPMGESKPHSRGSAIRANFRDNVDSSILGPGGKDALHFLGDEVVDGIGNLADGNFGSATKSMAIGLVFKKLGPLSGKVGKLIDDARGLYPGKAGKIEMHHVTPKYLGGPTNGPMVPLDAAYHQQITNAFRDSWKYGQGNPSSDQLQKIMNDVYSKYPLP